MQGQIRLPISVFVQTTNNKMISVDGGKDLIGELINVQITEINNKSLKGEILII